MPENVEFEKIQTSKKLWTSVTSFSGSFANATLTQEA